MSHPLFKLLARLDLAKIRYSLGRHQADTVMIAMTLVGERAEVLIFADGHMEVSRFLGDESVVGGAEVVDRLIADNRE